MGLNAKLSFVGHSVPSLEGDDVSVIRLELWQAISELFTLTIRLRARDSHIDMREVVGRMANVELFKDEGRATPQGFLPRIRGVVRRGHQLSLEETGKSTYELVIVPPLWLTSLRTVCHIFNDRTAPEIAADIVEDYHRAGITSVNVPRLPPTATRRREYTVQYNEADSHCFRRVLAEDGVAFVFGGAALDELILTRDTAAAAASVHASLPLLPSGAALHGDADAVLAVELGPSLKSGSQRLRDYFFDNPFFHPEGEHKDDGAFELVSIVGGREYQEGALHEAQPPGSALMSDGGRKEQARIRLEGRRRDHQTLTAELTCPLPAGAHLTITGDEHPAANRPQLVVRAVSILEFSEDAGKTRVLRSHRVACIPASYPYRPPLLDKPRIHGLQRAAVGGTEEIDVDEHGRVLVVFQWDNRFRFGQWKGPPETVDAATRRIPVAQDWAGPNRGLLTLPRLGDEVAVAYIDGDPDQPIIVGRLYNGRNRAAVNLPEDRTQSVWRTRSSPNGDGFHEIRFEDKVGAEELHIEAERLSTRLVKGAEQIDVGGSRDITVGASQTMRITGDLEIETGRDIVQRAGGSHRVYANGRSHMESGGRTEDSGTSHEITAGKIRLHAPKIELTTGGASITLDGGVITIQGSIVNINP